VSTFLGEDQKEYSLKHSDKRTDNIKDVKFFLFVVGFDRNSNPRLYYLENETSPAFEIQERILFNTGNDLEIATMSTNSGKTEFPSETMSNYVNYENNVMKRSDVTGIVIDSFNKTKDILSKQNNHIGGKTFVSIMDPVEGYENL